MFGITFERSAHPTNERRTNRNRLRLEFLEGRDVPADLSLTVTTLTDVIDPNDGVLSLREAIAAVNNAVPTTVHRITFGPGAQEGFISLVPNQGELIVTEKVIIKGPGANKVEVWGHDGEGADIRVFTIAGPGKTVEIEDLAIKKGSAIDEDPNGGGIKVLDNCNLILRRCDVSLNGADGDGGGIWVGQNGYLELRGTTVQINSAQGNGGGIAAVNPRQVWVVATAMQWSDINYNSAERTGGGLYLYGTGDINPNQAKLIIDQAKFDHNTARGWDSEGTPNGLGHGAGLYLEWTGNTTNNKAVDISRAEITNNYAITGRGGGIYVRADTKFGAGVKVNDNWAGRKDGEGIYVSAPAKVDGQNALEVKRNLYMPPQPPPGGEGGELDPDPGDPISTPETPIDPEDDPNYLPSAIYIEEGAEFLLAGAVIEDNDGHGVRGIVISLGNNYVENSLTTSSGWIATDTVT